MSDLVKDKPATISAMFRDIRFLIYDGFQILDAAGPSAAFEIAARLQPEAYRISVLSLSGGRVRSSSGCVMDSGVLCVGPPGSTLVVVGGQGVDAAADEPVLLEFVRSESSRGRVAAVCTGVFVLAAAGLLNGRKATTHWRRSSDLRAAYPDIDLRVDSIYQNDGHIWTSAGISAGIDLALAIIASDLGEVVARNVAREMIVYFKRPGGQSQHSALLEMSTDVGRMGPVLDYIRGNLHGSLSVEALASRAGMSQRHFTRVFRAEVGMSPARAVERLRIEAAAARLESGASSVGVVAMDCGYASVNALRRAFLRWEGKTPNQLKRGNVD